MKEVTLNVKDKAGIIIGTVNISEPETLEELTENWDEKTILKCFRYGYRVQERSPVHQGTGNSNLAKFKKLTPEQQIALLEKLSA